jgi:hypothetical protein
MSSCSGSDSDPACDTLQDKEYEAIVPQATFTELKGQGLTFIEEEPILSISQLGSTASQTSLRSNSTTKSTKS